jgi:hypothetical protein
VIRRQIIRVYADVSVISGSILLIIRCQLRLRKVEFMNIAQFTLKLMELDRFIVIGDISN